MENVELEKYIGTKIIQARPMTRGAYNHFKGWTIPADENPADEGYIVVYKDDYISWSPKEAFEEAYRIMTGEFDFGFALTMLKLGFKVARKGWNGAGMFVYLVPENAYPATTEAAKSHFGDSLVPYREYLALKTAQGDVATWAPSGSDALAEDWMVIE